MTPRVHATVGERRTIKAARVRPGHPVPDYRNEEAEVFGPLAVLPEPPENAARGLPHGWALLHVGTGRALGPTLPDRLAAVEAVRLLRHEDWAFAHPAYAPDSLALKVRSAMREILGARAPTKEEPGGSQTDCAAPLRPGRAA